MTSTIIITIVVILGIIIAGGFLLYFMGDILMSVANRKRDDKTLEDKKERDTQKIKEQIDQLGEAGEQLKKEPEIADVLYSGAIVESYNPEEEEKAAQEAQEAEQAVEENEEVEEAEEDEEEEEKSDASADRDAYIEQRRKELMERLAKMAEESDEEDEDEEEEESDEEESDEEVDLDEEAEEEDASEEEESTEEDDSELEETKNALSEERAKNYALLQELDAMREKNANGLPTMSMEELQEALAVEQERLKANEKELRACKKEYIPLRRVKRTLERDEKKLRRKEALVAKQKVVLYSVNNYADIDEEKAKKLAEDLDLYDGLKLSVEHCRDVMEKNKERYPLLEKIFEVLSTQNAEIKADIERIQADIEKLQNVGNDDSDAE